MQLVGGSHAEHYKIFFGDRNAHRNPVFRQNERLAERQYKGNNDCFDVIGKEREQKKKGSHELI